MSDTLNLPLTSTFSTADGKRFPSTPATAGATVLSTAADHRALLGAVGDGTTVLAVGITLQAPTATVPPITLQTTDDDLTQPVLCVKDSAGSVLFGIDANGWPYQTTDYAVFGNSAGSLTAVGQSAFGRLAGRSNSGTYQTAIGFQTGDGNTGDEQSAFGQLAGRNNSGLRQIAFGTQAGNGNSAHYCVQIGYFAGQNNTGLGQVAVGYEAGKANTGLRQTAVGYQAGQSNTAANCIFLGYEAGKSNTLANRFIVHHGSASTTRMLQGDMSTVRLGVGLPAAQTLSYTLDVGGDIAQSALSSTSVLRPRARWRSSWIDSTDATRKAQSTRSVWDTAERDVQRDFADGARGYTALKVSATAPADSALSNGEVVFYTDGSGQLKIKLKDTGGTVRTGTVALT